MATKSTSTRSWWQIFSDKFLEYHTDDPKISYRGYLIGTMSLAFIALIVLLPLLTFFGIPPIFEGYSSIAVLGAFILTYVLTRLGFLQSAGFIAIVAVVLAGLMGQAPMLIAVLIIAYVIILAGLLIGPLWMFLVAILGSGAASIFLYTYPTSDLVEPRLAIVGGILVFYLLIALTTYFLLQQEQVAYREVENQASELERARENLEVEVSTRTKELRSSLDLIDELSHIINTSINLENLFVQAIYLIEEKFEFIRVYIYLKDTEARDWVKFYSSNDLGSGSLGQNRIGKTATSVLNTVMVSGQTILVNDINSTNDPVSPDVQAEMTLPLQKGTETIGVINAQSLYTNVFGESMQKVLQILTKQLGTAIINIQATLETRTALEQVETLNQQLTQQKWEQTLKHQRVLGYLYTPDKTEPSPEAWLSSMSLALEKDVQQPVTASEQEIAIPLLLKGQVIGILGLERKSNQPWSEDEIVALQSITDQIALALDAARLAQETERSAWRNQMVSDSTAEVWSSSEIEEVLKAAVNQLGTKLGASEVVIHLGVEDEFAEETV